MRCPLNPSGTPLYQSLCCPLGDTPDPNFCTWRAGSLATSVGLCTPGCNAGEISIATNTWAELNGSPFHCFTGYASYCCEAVESGNQVCGWNDDACVQIEDGQPIQIACPAGRDFVTYAMGTGGEFCNGPLIKNSNWLPFCCDSQVKPSCMWVGTSEDYCLDTLTCPVGYINLGAAQYGDGENCLSYDALKGIYSPGGKIASWPRSLCCNAADLSLTVNTLPVPLADLFPTPGPSTDSQTWNIELDLTMGGAATSANPSQDPNQNSFGWYIMSGPSDEITTLDKRDGSHWDVYDCEHDGVERQTAKAVCIDESDEANCGIIWKGRGVAETVIELPPGCGAGRYAMAVGLEPAANQTLPSHLDEYGLKNPVVYDLTFDYDFTPLQRRGDSNVLLRIDYSNDPGYWSQIVGMFLISTLYV